MPTDVHGGRIVFTCTRKGINQICLIKADGTGYAQLTSGEQNSYYPDISPDGNDVVFAVNKYDDFDLGLIALRAPVEPQSRRLSENIGNVFCPVFSPDGTQIAFVNKVVGSPAALWTMGLHGEQPRPLYQPAHDIAGAAWSPDGKAIAFTMSPNLGSSYEVFILDLEAPARAPRRVSQGLSGIGGSVSWSSDRRSILVFAGPVAAREIYRLDAITGAHTQLSFGGNNAAAAYSPDGQMIVFNSLRNGDQADLYTMRADGHSIRQLTNNPEPDWQPQWGP
jgi:Tol biopolymer transport system component